MREQRDAVSERPVLLPGFTKHMSSLASLAPAEPALKSELHIFLDKVVCDGRFLREVDSDPYRVAEELGFELTPETTSQLRAMPLQQHLTELYARKFAEPGPIPIIIVIAIVAIVAFVAIVVAIPKHRGSVKDNSPHANSKL